MLCSVLIPTLNSQSHLEQVLRAACSDSTEILVCDGGSSDATLGIAASFGRFVRVVRSEPGFARQLGAGVREARGHTVVIIGADVVLPAGAIDDLLDESRRNPHVALQVPRVAVSGPGLGRRISAFILQETFRSERGTSVLSGCSVHQREQLSAALVLAEDCDAFDFDTCLAQSYDELGITRRLAESVVVGEYTVESAADLVRQHLHYGAGDAHFFLRNRDLWSLSRRVRSLLHPFRRYMVELGGAALRRGRVDVLPGLLVCMVARYLGWAGATAAGVRARPHWS